MSREANIPLALWISAALVAHFAGGGGAMEVAKIVEDKRSLQALVTSLREGLRPPDTTFEILTDEALPTPSPQAAAPPTADPPENDDEPAADEDAIPDPAAKPSPKAKPDPKAPPPKVAATPPEPKEKEPEPPKPPEVPKVEQAKVEPVPIVPVAPPPPPPEDHRLAIRQHVQPDQEDNPTASRIADDANHTTEETMARTRSYDQDDANPTPGTHAGPKGEIGDGSDHDKVGQSEEKKGDATHAPGEAAKSSTSPEHSNPTPPSPAPAKMASKDPPSVPGRPGGGSAPTLPAPPPAPPPRAGGAGPASPEVVDGANGGYTLDPANPGGDGRSKVAGRRRVQQPAYVPPVRVGSVGLGAPGALGGPNINLTMAGVEAAVGSEKLKAERAADGAARRSAHRGSWEANKFERWRAAIENYEPSVKLGNQTSLNAARVPFATYINTIHNRLHPIFAEEFLASLDGLPPSHQLNQELVTHLEIVLGKDDGRIVRLGVTKASGVTAFDIVALNSVSRAGPFGKAPDVIVSPDGNVYLHWEFHRDPFDACTTRNARPFMLKSAPTVTPAPLLPKKGSPLKPSAGDEPGAPPPPLLPLRRP